MAEVFIELASEEIPPSMQEKMAESLWYQIGVPLSAIGFEFSQKLIEVFFTPRRIGGCMEVEPKILTRGHKEIRGPSADAPEAALEGFLKKVGKGARPERRETEKGAYYYAVLKMPPLKLEDALKTILPSILENFHRERRPPLHQIQFSLMRWPQSDMRWVRPLRGIVCLVDGKPVEFEAGGMRSGDSVRGHGVLSPKSFRVKSFADYQKKMKTAHVLISKKEREERIKTQAKALTDEMKLRAISETALLKESVGLTEWPKVFLGKIDETFMELGDAVLSEVLKSHQKCFALRKKNGSPAPYFLIVADNESKDRGKKIVAGNEDVVHARLADAKFFINRDRAKGLEHLRDETDKIMLHERLGSMKEKSERLQQLVESPLLQKAFHGNYPLEVLREAARYAKADLASEMVADQPSLQGEMSDIYWEGEKEVADAIAEHYRPIQRRGRLPTSPAGVLLALCDKADTLAGFFKIGETPTGSKDPYALRRTAQGIVRLIVSGGVSRKHPLPFFSEGLDLRSFFMEVYDAYQTKDKEALWNPLRDTFIGSLQELLSKDVGFDIIRALMGSRTTDGAFNPATMRNFAINLEAFLKTEEGKDLLHAYKRTHGILGNEGLGYDLTPQSFRLELLHLQAEKDLARHLTPENMKRLENDLQRRKFGDALGFLAKLREPVDNFFTDVHVNNPDEALRENRFLLLATLKDTMDKVIDFSQIAPRE